MVERTYDHSKETNIENFRDILSEFELGQEVYDKMTGYEYTENKIAF